MGESGFDLGSSFESAPAAGLADAFVFAFGFFSSSCAAGARARVRERQQHWQRAETAIFFWSEGGKGERGNKAGAGR